MSLLLLAAEEAAEPSKALFYALASALVAYALILAAVGTARHETFPPSASAQKGVVAVGVLLVAGTMFAAVITA